MTPSDAPRGATPPDDARRDVRATTGRDDRREAWKQLDQASVMTVELMSAVLVWGGAGWLLDRWLHTAPWLMGIGVMTGFAAGLYLVWLRSTDRTHTTAPGVTAPGADTKGSPGGTD
jgi:F0F1-type ATP synthase assembly protein I